MKLSMIAYLWCVIIGAYMLVFTPGGVIVVCIACGSTFTNIAAVISVAIGAIGIYNSISSRANVKG
ncbi:MAG TPA: hypothetical protein VHP12_07425 [Chitinophagaceae bacterium]|nr:hypothetical protein [Chitinophagaceae bacterium]